MSGPSRTGLPRWGVLMALPIIDGNVVEVARRAEAIGFDTFYMPDHFNEVISPVPAIAAVAETTSMRVGAYMLANDLRHPATVARDFAALDVLSGGRVELGIGAGWWPADYHAIGVDMDRPSLRISRLREAVNLIRACWTAEQVDHDGTWYRTRLEPMTRPVQDPHPPIIVGGGGPKLLRVAAEVADVVSIGIPLTSGRREDMVHTAGSTTFEEVARRIETVRKESLRDPLIDMMLFRVAVADRPDEPVDSVDSVDSVARAGGLTPRQVRESPYLQVGPLADVIAGFEKLIALGIGSIVVRVADMEAAALVRRALG